MAITVNMTQTFENLQELLSFIDTLPDDTRSKFVKELKLKAGRELKRRKVAENEKS